MRKTRVFVLLVALTLTYFYSAKISATTLICWDGSLVTTLSDCEDKPEPLSFKIFGASVEGASVSAFIINNDAKLFEITAYGETGRVDYKIRSDSAQIRTTHYNMPIYMEGFDPSKSKLFSIEEFKLRRTEDGVIVTTDFPDEVSDKKAIALTCLINSIYNHLGQSEAKPENLHVDCR